MTHSRNAFLQTVWLFCAMLLGVATARAESAATSDHAGDERNAALSRESKPRRERIRFDDGWRFALGHATDRTKDFDFDTGYFSYLAKAGYGDGPADPHFDDRAWRLIDLPHDWAVELPFSEKASASHGFKALGRAFPENSVGWYRKKFFVPAKDLGRRIHVTFDGVYRDAAVFVNGFFVGRAPSGYTGVDCDLTDYLRYDADNILTVRVDATDEEGWFYEGAGIYRHVWLTKTAPAHFVSDGTAIATLSVGERSEISTAVEILSETKSGAFQFRESVVDPTGKEIASTAPEWVQLHAGAAVSVERHLTLPGAKLWSLETPNLYSLVTVLSEGAAEVDRAMTTFGVRTVRFDPDHGFFLNEQHVVIKGTNNHQDHAGVGVAIPDALQIARIERLKEFGSNAYRCSHNPPTPELLEACDRLGMLVIDENRLMGINEYHLDQLANMIRRDRNHPSVILWSLGNEEWAIEGNITGTRVARTMQDFAHRLDPSRVCTVAISGGREHGISASIDVMGYNYIAQGTPDEHRALYPLQPGIGTEETTTQGTRGTYSDEPSVAHEAALENGSSGGNCEVGWQYYASRPYLAGLFFWTGFDYRGEPTPFGWPAISSQFGILDTCGFPKDSFYYLKAWWTDTPLVHLSTSWTFPGHEGQAMPVRVESNCDEVELWLNNRSWGKRPVPINGHALYTVAYATGELRAEGYRKGRKVATDHVATATEARGIALQADRLRVEADGGDVAVISVRVVDRKNRTVPNGDNEISFNLSGPAKIIGVGNGDPSSHERDQWLAQRELLSVENWAGRIVTAPLAEPSNHALDPIVKLGNWRAKPARAGEQYELSATFTLENVSTDAENTLFLPASGERESVWVNGHAVAYDVGAREEGPAVVLPVKVLVAGTNRIRILATPIVDGKNHIAERSANGSVLVQHPAPVWQRKVFNGWAQVLVQTEPRTGKVKLRATSEGLAPAELDLDSVAHLER